jgi:hypothetical protein
MMKGHAHKVGYKSTRIASFTLNMRQLGLMEMKPAKCISHL